MGSKKFEVAGYTVGSDQVHLVPGFWLPPLTLGKHLSHIGMESIANLFYSFKPDIIKLSLLFFKFSSGIKPFRVYHDVIHGTDRRWYHKAGW